jgi:hypothetical protein
MNIDRRYAKRYDQYLFIIGRAAKEVKGAGKNAIVFDKGEPGGCLLPSGLK